jgi:hypothetical protein
VAIGSGQCEVWRVYLLFNIYMFCILFVCVLVFLVTPLLGGSLDFVIIFSSAFLKILKPKIF